jgi:RNA polymerase sigma-54 factor
MRFKSICLTCRGADLPTPCVKCKGYGFVFVEMSKKPQEKIVVTYSPRSAKTKAAFQEKTFNAIREFQKEYFETWDVMKLRPMKLSDIATIVGLDQATISCYLRGQTIDGIDAKWLFSTEVCGLSNKAIKHMISKMDHSLSDMEIAEKLKLDGITISRRTVTKYRHECGVPSSHKFAKK